MSTEQPLPLVANLPAREAEERAISYPVEPLCSLELFTGAGGLALGTHLAGFRHRLLLEWNADARATLSANAAASSVAGIEPWRVMNGDARETDFAAVGAVDLIAGGPPCQPFSIGGKHHGWDDRRDMLPQFVRAVRELAPRAFILENVRGLLRPTFAAYFRYVLRQLSHPGVVRRKDEPWPDHLRRLKDVQTGSPGPGLHYDVAFRLLNAADYGVPQTRERVFIVGFRADTGVAWQFPEPTHGRGALLRARVATGAYWERHGLRAPDDYPSNGWRRSDKTELEPGNPRQPWRTVRDAITDLPEPALDCDDVGGVSNHRLRSGARAYPGHTGSCLDWPAKTLKAGDHGVPGGENMIAFPDGSVRYFTVREAARLQTFPDGWRFSGSWSEAMRQLGNAVPVHLARVIATGVAERLRSLDVESATRRD